MTYAIALLLALGAAPALAANAEQPNTNVDKSNDKGGPTGNDKTDQLNRAQQSMPATTTTTTTVTPPAPTQK